MKQVKDLSLSIGGNIKEEVTTRFVDAWHRAEKGQRFQEQHLAFENWHTLARVLTGSA
jgi:hypothetical protein